MILFVFCFALLQSTESELYESKKASWLGFSKENNHNVLLATDKGNVMSLPSPSFRTNESRVIDFQEPQKLVLEVEPVWAEEPEEFRLQNFFYYNTASLGPCLKQA